MWWGCNCRHRPGLCLVLQNSAVWLLLLRLNMEPDHDNVLPCPENAASMLTHCCISSQSAPAPVQPLTCFDHSVTAALKVRPEHPDVDGPQPRQEGKACKVQCRHAAQQPAAQAGAICIREGCCSLARCSWLGAAQTTTATYLFLTVIVHGHAPGARHPLSAPAGPFLLLFRRLGAWLLCLCASLPPN